MDFLIRRRKSILAITAAAALSAYAAHRTKHAKLTAAISSLAASISSAADIAGVLSSDLHRFLSSDSDEIPPSLTQLSKIAASEEFTGSISRVSESLTAGIVRGIQSMEGSDSRATTGFSDLIFEKLFTAAGTRFSSIVVGSFAKNLITAYLSSDPEHVIIPTPWVNAICAENCRDLITGSIQTFVGTAMTVYLDKTMHINTYNELFAGLTNPQYEARAKEMLVSICNGAMETLVRTSHRVLTNSEPFSFESNVESFRQGKRVHLENSSQIPSNRKFVLDVTGRVTFETVRSVLEFSMLKVSNGMISSGVKVAEKGLEVMRYVSARYIAIATLCFVLCMHVFARQQV